MSTQLTAKHDHGHNVPLTLAIIIGATGVVFGDIGTSPLYAFNALFLELYRCSPI